LEVHAAHHAAARARVVVLDPLEVYAQLNQMALLEALQEEAPLVTVDDGLEQEGISQLGGQRAQLGWPSRRQRIPLSW
jgi:hypothetical protein